MKAPTPQRSPTSNRRAIRRVRLAPLRGAAALLALAATIAAYAQYRAPFAWHEPYRAVRDLLWWAHPVEWNVDAGLPDIGPGVNGITLYRGTVWLAGNGGFLAFSADTGRTWTTLQFDGRQRRFAVPPGVSLGAPAPKSAAWNLVGLIEPPVYAASPGQSKAPSSPTQTQQTAPPPQSQSGAKKSPDAPIQPSRPQLAASLDAVKFDDVPVGQNKSILITFKVSRPADGPVVAIDLPKNVIVGGENAFSIGASDCDAINSKQACTMYLLFAPKTSKAYQAVVSWWNLSIPISGSGFSIPPSSTPAASNAPPATPSQSRASSSADAPVALAPDLIGFAFCNEGTECRVIGTGNRVFRTLDDGASWTDVTLPGAGAQLVDRATEVGSWRLSGGGLEHSDGGRWLPATRTAAAALPGHAQVSRERRYIRFVPPWYLLALLLGALLLQLEPSTVAKPEPDAAPDAVDDDAEITGNHGTADKPLEPGQPDALGLSAIAAGLAIFLRNEDTKPPLVIAINGRWGSGKSSLMNLLRGNLEKFGTRPVWFNAWHHQSEDQLLAALLQSVKTQAVPPLWGRGGWSFRARLAASRFERFWPQVALGVAALYVIWRAEPVVLRWLLESAPDAGKGAGTGTPSIGVKDVISWLESKWLVTIVTSGLTVGKALSGGLRAFATDPASLLAAEAAGTTAKALQAQTSFRQEFAREFGEVTWALGKRRRMLILVDDLDRCRPEKVREVLEAVNFLVSSGDCFVVLGMAREIVEHCVGLSFQSVVDTMPWHSFDISSADIERTMKEVGDGVTKDVPADVAGKRRAFARLFMDKLIQIELSLPEPTPIQKRRLFEGTDAKTARDFEREERVDSWLGVVRTASRVTAPVLQTVIVTAIVIGVAIESGRLLGPSIFRQPSRTDAAIQAARLASDVAATRYNPATLEVLRTTTPPAPLPAPQIVPSSIASSSEWLAAWPFYLFAFGFGLLTLGAIGEVPQTVVRDDEAFVKALQVWHPLVLTTGARNTPRTARRFQNRVRYLAMRQRALSLPPPMSRAESWLRRAFAAPARQPDPPARLRSTVSVADADVAQLQTMLDIGLTGPMKIATVKATADGLLVEPNPSTGLDAAALWALATGNIHIPETILVALAAIDEHRAEWITDPDAFQAISVGTLNEPGALRDALEEHKKLWNNWNNVAHYRRAYLRLCSEVSGPATNAGSSERVI
jgi:hypothetical protein